MNENVVVCPQCGTKNRIKSDGSDQVPVCGKCKNPLPWLVTATDQSFAQEIQGGVPVLVDFWAEWCGPCRMVAPVLEELAQDNPGRLKVVKLNVDQNPVTAGHYQIRSIPTMLLFKNGQVVDSLIGAMSKNALVRRLQPHLT